MLESLHLKNVGPASEMEMHLAERLNVITGDNGLGKTFLLDMAWWALAKTWSRGLVVPDLPPAEPELICRYRTSSEVVEKISRFDRRAEQWYWMSLGDRNEGP